MDIYEDENSHEEDIEEENGSSEEEDFDIRHFLVAVGGRGNENEEEEDFSMDTASSREIEEEDPEKLEEKLKTLEEVFSFVPRVLIKRVLCRDDINGDLNLASQRLQEFQDMENPLDLFKTPTSNPPTAWGPPPVWPESENKGSEKCESQGSQKRRRRGGFVQEHEDFQEFIDDIPHGFPMDDYMFQSQRGRGNRRGRWNQPKPKPKPKPKGRGRRGRGENVFKSDLFFHGQPQVSQRGRGRGQFRRGQGGSGQGPDWRRERSVSLADEIYYDELDVSGREGIYPTRRDRANRGRSEPNINRGRGQLGLRRAQSLSSRMDDQDSHTNENRGGDAKFEAKKLLICGLSESTADDGVLNFIEAMSGEEVETVEMSKGKALVTMTEDITNFHKIKEKAERRGLESARVTIQRVPVCRSILVSGISEDTNQDAIELFFENPRNNGGPVETVRFKPESVQAVLVFQNSTAPHHSPTQSEFPENVSEEGTLEPDEIKQADEILEHVVMEEPLSSPAPHNSPSQSEFPGNGSKKRTLQPNKIKQADEIQEHVVMEEPLSSRVSQGLPPGQFASELPVKESADLTYGVVSESKEAVDGREHTGIKERPVSSDSSSVPSEIIARGPEAKRAYENALRNGKVKVYRGRIMLIGQDRAGKTSLKKNLVGMPFDPQQQSTDGIEVDPFKFEYDIDQVKNWKRTDGKLGVSHFADDLAKMVAGKLKEEETNRAQKANDDDTHQVAVREEKSEDTEEAQFHSHIANQTEKVQAKELSSTIPELKIDPSSPPEDFTEILIQHLKGLTLQKEKTTEHHITLDLWDFAGQHLYYASYPVFLSKRAVYILVYNLSKSLTMEAQPSVRQNNCETPLRNPSSETNLDNLLSWLISVSTMCSGKQKTNANDESELMYLRPPVLIVGTHADDPCDNIKDIELQIQRAIFGKSFCGHVIRPFFSISNMPGSDGEQINALQDKIIEVLQQEPYMGEEVPLRWFNFEKVVEGLVAAKIHFLALKDLRTVVREVCFIEDEKEMDTMLDFYHDLGMIVKHRNTVILKSQWLIQIFRQLITVRRFNEMEPKHSQLWREMETTGILRMELVDHVFSEFCQQGMVRKDILNLMEQFGLIAKFVSSPDNEMYFVPAQLSTPPGNLCKVKVSPSDPCPLYLQFPAGFVPHGLFSHLVSFCTRWCSEIEFKRSPCLFQGAARFILLSKKLSHQLILVCKKRFIKIVLLNQSQRRQVPLLVEIEEMASLVWRFLNETMTQLLKDLPYVTSLQYNWCIACIDCMCEQHGQVSCMHDDCLCLRKIPQEGQLEDCPKSVGDKTCHVPGLEKWFPIKDVHPRHHPETDSVYKMTALPRGMTLIINNELFAHHDLFGQQSPRHGSGEDVRQVKELFGALGFEVHIKQNRMKKEIMDEVYQFAYERVIPAHDCFVLWLMSHGRSEEVFGSDGRPLAIQSIKDILSNANCEPLKGKPKLLFIQACRGDQEDQGVDVLTNLTNTCASPSPRLPLPSACPDSPTEQTEAPTPEKKIIAGQSDFLTAYSTVDGYVSYRFPDIGSHFVRALVDVFREHVARDHLVNLLIEVNKRVGDMESVDKGRKFKQAPQFETTLVKQLWF